MWCEMRRHGLLEARWERIKDFLPGGQGQVGGTSKDNLLFVDAILDRCRAVIPRRD